MKKQMKRVVVALCVVGVCLITGFGALELGARVIWKKKYNEWLETQLHGYDRVDYEKSIIITIPNITVTAGEHRRNLKILGKTLGLTTFEKEVPESSVSDSRVVFTINKYGFKGPEISIPKPPGVFRILTIGDSCTWGPGEDYYSYPRTMERELNQVINQELHFEVVNAGFPGYNFERVLKRVDEFLVTEPDLVTIYLGWNRTISRADPRKSLSLYRQLALYRVYYHFLLSREDTGLRKDYNKHTVYDKKAPALELLRNYDFSYDISDLDALVSKIRADNKNRRIVIVTLAGLFDIEVEPDQRALDIAYPTASTNNLYAYPILTKRYNNELREYTRDKRLDLIDLEAYARKAFLPRSEYFTDSVHPTRQGYVEIGNYLAKEILRIGPFREKAF